MQDKNVSAAFDKLFAWHVAAFPAFAHELDAVAQGAGIDPRDLFLYSFKNELLAVYGEQSPDTGEDACSDVLVNLGGCHLDGHNEDGEAELANASYWVRTDTFEAMAYPGALAGGAFGFNRHGLVLTMNALSPRGVAIEDGCVGKYWLGRWLLGAESIGQVLEILRGSCHAYGLSLNVGSIATKEQLNVEVGPGAGLSALRVANGSYFHANAYLHLSVAEDPGLSPSSAHREARASQLMPAASRADVRDILGDTQDARWPIYRSLGHGDYAATLATALFDYNSQVVEIWSGGNPRTTRPVLRRSMSDMMHQPPLVGRALV